MGKKIWQPEKGGKKWNKENGLPPYKWFHAFDISLC